MHEKQVKLEYVEGQWGAVLLCCRNTVRSGEIGRLAGIKDRYKFSYRMDEFVVEEQ
jgi:hypothetical protein